MSGKISIGRGRRKQGRHEKSSYARAGVNIDEKMSALSAIKRMVGSTSVSGTLGGIGSFGGFFKSPGKEEILVASTDGVGTKIKVAVMAGRHDTVGQDLVNHCVNDILVHGASPMFFMDYVGTSKLRAPVLCSLVSGLCKACRENGCALLGGETAELPGVYPGNEYDLVGTIVGRVSKADLIAGRDIRPGDAILGLPSTGLHTNGYSLARRIIFEQEGLRVTDRFPGAGKSVADVLLAVHRSYLRPVSAVMRKVRIRGMAHITGGGFPDNVPRVLPDNCTAVFDRSSWKIPVLFRFLQEKGRVDREEMYRVFNMGIGLVMIVREGDASEALRTLRASGAGGTVIGRIVKGRRGVVLQN